MVFVREFKTDNKQEQPFVCPIDFSDIKCTHKQKNNLKSLFQKHASTSPTALLENPTKLVSR